MTSEKKPANWSQIRRHLKGCSRPALLALAKDLYDASAANRDFLHARFQADGDSGEALEKYRRKIVEQFFPQRGFGNLKLAEARKAIRDYRKATGNLPGTAELLMTYVENGEVANPARARMYTTSELECVLSRVGFSEVTVLDAPNIVTLCTR